MSLEEGALPGVCSALSPSGSAGTAPACHNQLVAQGCVCKAALITIVTRASFLAGFVPLACLAKWGCVLHGARLAVLEDALVFCPLPLCDSSLTLPITSWFLSWLLSVPFPALPCLRAPGLVLEGPKSCWEESQGSKLGFLEQQLQVGTPITQGGGAYRIISAWVIGFSFCRVECWSFPELFQPIEMSSRFWMAGVRMRASCESQHVTFSQHVEGVREKVLGISFTPNQAGLL